jgi:RNA polymerase sigma-70 factor (ECF subfamily)
VSKPEQRLQDKEFVEATDPHRRELTVHCYRMLGSQTDAEDLVQETYLRAWRGWGDFEGRASVRTWLYRIATNACLNALEGRDRRALPSGLVPAKQDDGFDVDAAWADSTWIEPAPDSLLSPPTPEALLLEKTSTRLAMVAALQTLSARERAAVVLHDVVRLTAAEVAQSLETTPAAVNSALQRARARLALAQPREDEIVEPDDPACRVAVDRYVEAMQAADIPLLVDLFRRDVTLEMPPAPTWFSGRDDVLSFYRLRVSYADQWRMVATSANGQPAAAAYLRNADGLLMAHGVHVLTLTRTGVARVVAFRKPGLLPAFGLPGSMPD